MGNRDHGNCPSTQSQVLPVALALLCMCTACGGGREQPQSLKDLRPLPELPSDLPAYLRGRNPFVEVVRIGLTPGGGGRLLRQCSSPSMDGDEEYLVAFGLAVAPNSCVTEIRDMLRGSEVDKVGFAMQVTCLLGRTELKSEIVAHLGRTEHYSGRGGVTLGEQAAWALMRLDGEPAVTARAVLAKLAGYGYHVNPPAGEDR